MGKLDEFFKSLKERRKKRPEVEVLEDIESALRIGDLGQALGLTEEIETETNRFLALRMILRKILDIMTNPEETAEQQDVQTMGDTVKEIIPLINSVTHRRYRAILLADLAVVLYLLNDELNGDFALKTAINLSQDSPDVLREILMELIRRGLLRKAGYAMKMVREPEKLDVVLVHLAELFYRAGDPERAKLIMDHISSPFHKAMALYYIASIEGENDRQKALKIIDAAFKVAEQVNDPEARFELILKLYDLKYSLLGEGLSLREILSRREAPPQ